MRTFSLVLIWLVIPAIAAAGPGHADAAADISLEEISWLAGYWQSDERGVLSEECWLAPGGNVMLGLHRDVFADGRTFFEYLRIMETAEGLVYYATPKGYETTKFRLTSYDERDGVREVVFENPEHVFPSLIRYTLDARGLMAQAEGIDDGEPVVETWTWTRSAFQDRE
jgi:hypothetical protein